MEAPYTLRIHLYSGQIITLPCEGYEIVQASFTEDGKEIPMQLNYTPIEDWQSTLGFLDFRAVTAIEVQRSPAAVVAG